MAKLTPSGPLRNVLADLPGRVGLLSNQSLEDEFGHARVLLGTDAPSLRTRQPCRRTDAGGGVPAERTLVNHFIGGNMSLRRRLLVECGGFDAALRRHVPRSRTTWSCYYSKGLSTAVVKRLVGLEWTVSSEKSYLWSIIPRGIGRNLGNALCGQPTAIAGVMALTLGVLMTGIGYTVGRILLPRDANFTRGRWPTMTELGAVG